MVSLAASSYEASTACATSTGKPPAKQTIPAARLARLCKLTQLAGLPSQQLGLASKYPLLEPDLALAHLHLHRQQVRKQPLLLCGGPETLSLEQLAQALLPVLRQRDLWAHQQLQQLGWLLQRGGWSKLLLKPIQDPGDWSQLPKLAGLGGLLQKQALLSWWQVVGAKMRAAEALPQAWLRHLRLGLMGACLASLLGGVQEGLPFGPLWEGLHP